MTKNALIKDSSFFPADRLESYRTSPYKDRIDRIGQRLVEQRYHHEVTAQHLREWLRVTHYLQEQELRLPLALKAPEVEQYVADRVVGLSASRTGRIPDFPEQCVGKDGL